MNDLAGFLGSAVLWVTAAHVIFVIFLIAGLFMLPRFFVYHHETPVGSLEDARWVEREARLVRIILNPSLLLVWALGLALAFNLGVWDQGWFHAKLLLVVALSAYHGWAVGYAKKLARGERRLGDRTLRLLNEVPGVVTAIVVVLVIAKPF